MRRGEHAGNEKRWLSTKAEQRISANNRYTWPSGQRHHAHKSKVLNPWQSYTTNPSPTPKELPVCPTQTIITPASLWTKQTPEHQVSPQPTSNKHTESLLPPSERSQCSVPRVWVWPLKPGCLSSNDNLVLTGVSLVGWLILPGPQFSHLKNGAMGTHLAWLIHIEGLAQ